MPPVATNLFVGAAIFKEPFGKVARAVLPTLGIVCAALVALMYVPTISTGALNLKRGQPVYTAFPWDGKPPAVVDTVVVAVPKGKAMTMEEMMRAAELKLANDGGAADAPPPKKKAMTMEEMMRAAEEKLKAEETAAATLDAGT
jgi:hypothetical protein